MFTDKLYEIYTFCYPEKKNLATNFRVSWEMAHKMHQLIHQHKVVLLSIIFQHKKNKTITESDKWSYSYS